MNPYPNQSASIIQNPVPTLREIIAILFRNWKIIVGGGLSLAAIFLISGAWVPRYQSEMKILVQRQRSDNVISAASDNHQQPIDSQISEEDLNSEVELLGGEDLLRSVVLSVGLDRRLSRWSPRSDEARISSAVRSLRKALTIEAIHKTHVISIRYSSSDPSTTAEVLNALSRAYLAKHKEVHRPSGEISFFEQQTTRFKQDLEKAQKELTDFSRQTGIVSATVERDAALQKANDFAFQARQSAAQAAALQTKIQVMEAQLQNIQPRITTTVRVADNPQLLQNLKSTLLELQLKRTELATRFQPTYPLVRELDTKISETQQAISRETANPPRDETSDQNPDYQVTQRALLEARSELGALRSQQQAQQSLATQYRDAALHLDQSGEFQQNLVRNEKEKEESYLLYVRKREEATISAELDQRGILNVAIAQTPTVPVFPTHSPIAMSLLAFFLCCFGGVGMGIAADLMSSFFRTPGELAGYLSAPVLATLPATKR